MSNNSQRVTQWNAWKVISLGERVDSFNFQETRGLLESQVKPSALLAIDVNQVRFLSLATYKYMADLARRLRINNGQLALLSPTEKLKVQMGLLSSLENIIVVKHLDQLPSAARVYESPRPDGIPGF